MRNKYTIVGDEVHIHLNRGYSAIIDLADLSKADSIDGTWTCMPNSAGKPYVVYKKKGTKGYIRLHRYLTDCPEGLVVDHKDGDPLNNRRKNLEIATQRKNSANRQGANSNNTKTGVRGVTIFRGRYRARVGQMQVGTFDTLEEASEAVRIARDKLYGS